MLILIYILYMKTYYRKWELQSKLRESVTRFSWRHVNYNTNAGVTSNLGDTESKTKNEIYLIKEEKIEKKSHYDSTHAILIHSHEFSTCTQNVKLYNFDPLNRLCRTASNNTQHTLLFLSPKLCIYRYSPIFFVGLICVDILNSVSYC